ncbi:palmitoyl-(protein) hydrolase [Aureococcus anophagefferens]|nr:palmitoyl-(protein) hydrolase [Aureococcus anophagefferens]
MASFDRSAVLEIEETTRDHNRHDRSDVMHEVYSATAEELVDANGVEIRALSRLGEAPAADGSAVAVCALRCGEAVWEAYRARRRSARALPPAHALSGRARARRRASSAGPWPATSASSARRSWGPATRRVVVAEYAGFGLWRGRAAQKLAHGIWEKTMKRARQAVSADAKASRVLGDAVGASSSGSDTAAPRFGDGGVRGPLILDGWASADSRRVALTRLGRAFASVDAAGAGRVGRHLFGKLLLRSRDKWGGGGDDDDPALGDAFAAADRDGDGFVDLQDVVEWLSSAAQSQEKKNDRARRAREAAQRRFLASGVEDDRGAFAAWPLSEASATVGAVETFLLKLAKGRLAFHEARDRDPTETLTVAFGTEDACGEWWAAVSETLAIHRRLRSPKPAAADVPVVLFDEVGDDGDFEDVFEEAGAAPSTFGAIASALGALAGAKPPRSRRAQDARGRDGSVKWEVSTPRRAKSAWRTVVRLVIRPPRASYDVGELGPLSFEIPSLRDAQKKLACVRSDFTVVNDDGLKLACSLWSRVLDADDFDDRATWRRPGKASTEQRPKAFEKPCVLYLHGNASCRLECLPHVAPLLMLGLRVCAVDTSGSGLSEGEFVTLGEREAKDAACVAAHLVAAKRASVVALYGRSMGGVAAILGGARKAAFGGARRGVVACVVADSPFASLAGLAAGFFAGLSARGALAESAAKAAIDAVTAETYEFLAKHLSAPGTDDAELDAAAAKLDAYRPKIAGGHAPWTYCAQALKAPTKDRGGEFRSGMTDAREGHRPRHANFCG